MFNDQPTERASAKYKDVYGKGKEKSTILPAVFITDELPKTTEQTKINNSSFRFAIMVLQMKEEDDIYASN